MSAPGPIMELIGKVAYAFAEIQPLIPTYTHLLVSALFPIYAGAHSSLTRPASAAKPAKTHKHTGGEDSEDEEDEEEEIQKMEGLSASDALLFPIMAGVTLTGLYILIKWMNNVELLNKILNGYFAFFGIFSVSRFITDCFDFIHSFVFPSTYTDQGLEYGVSNVARVATQRADRTKKLERTSPLPGMLGRLPLPTSVTSALWKIRRLPYQKWTVKAHIHSIVSARARIGIHGFLGFFLGLAAVAWFNFVSKPWFLTNLMGFAFSYGAMQLLSPTTFATGTLLLSALFFYDIYMVFFTPMMVTVAKSLDVPIKLMFPRPDIPSPVEGRPPIKQHAMLGLGDVVIPGIMIGLALRFDLYMYYLRKQRRVETASDGASQPSGEVQRAPYRSVNGCWGVYFWNKDDPAGRFPKPYFTASLIGYVLGMLATLAVMQIANHAQPALLYLVPGVLIAIWGTALFRREIKDVWAWSEADEEVEEQVEGHDKKDARRKSILSAERAKEMEKRLEKAAGKYVEVEKADESGPSGDDAVRESSKDKKEKSHKKKADASNLDRTLFSFTITAPFSLRSKSTTSKPDTVSHGSSSAVADSRPNSSDSETRRRNWRAGTPSVEETVQHEGEQPVGKRRRLS